jgi:DNA-binding CsgD family transcriptional regulator
MYSLHAAAQDFAGAVRTCRSPRAVLALLNRQISALDPKHPPLQVLFVFRLEEQPDGPDDYAVERNVFWEDGLPRRQQLWQRMRADFRKHGPSALLRRAREGGLPFTLTELTRNARPRGTDRWILDLFLQFAIRDGFCCPVLPWVVLFRSTKAQELKLPPEQRASLHFVAKHAAYRLNEMRPAKKKKQKIKLAPREVDVLFHISEGETSEQIAARYGIKKGTVDDYAETATAKLGAKNRTHAVVMAIYLGLIKKR